MYKKLAWILVLILLLFACSNDDESEGENMLTGDWYGTIEIPDSPLPIEITFENDEELKGVISIPAQNLHDFALSNIDDQEEELSFDMNLPGQVIRFKADHLTEDRIEGNFHQGGMTFPFHLEKVNQDEEEAGEILSVDTDFGELKGELVVPDDGAKTAALIIPGSGPTDRNGNTAMGKNNSLKMLAELLEEEGIASLRYDKRGAGLNTEAVIAEEELTFEDFIDDAVVWLEKLQEGDRFDQLVVIGHSQGSLVGMLAANQVDVEAVISLAGKGQPIDEVLLEQLSAQLDGELLAEAEEILEALKQGNQVAEVSQPLQSSFRKSVQPFMISWMNYNPIDVIQQMDIPILVVSGTTDLQVGEEDAKKLAEASEDAQLEVIEGMNHVLKDAPEDRNENMQTYNQPNLPLSENLKQTIKQFLSENL